MISSRPVSPPASGTAHSAWLPSEHWWIALIDGEGGRREEWDVVQWRPDGDEVVGYVHDPYQGRIRRADRHPGFRCYERRPRVVTALPGMDWQVCYRVDTPSGSALERRPVLAWLVHDDGTVVPTDADGDGLVYRSIDTPALDHIEPPEQGREPDGGGQSRSS